MTYRTGIGYDIHRLVEDRKLFLGGIEITYVKGLLGHSDADALLHAICDALLGAIGQSDIGELFPNTDEKYHNISSIELLKTTAELVRKQGFTIVNIDSIVIAQEPNLSPFKKQMQVCIASTLDIENERVNVKAKTNEGIDEIGEKKAIACFATVILSKGG